MDSGRERIPLERRVPVIEIDWVSFLGIASWVLKRSP